MIRVGSATPWGRGCAGPRGPRSDGARRASGFAAGFLRSGSAVASLVLAACSSLSGDGGDADGADANRADLEGSVDLVHPAPFEGTRSELVFSPSRGVYEEPLDVTLTHPSASEVRYTLDGSDPRTSETTLTAALPLTLRVDPADTTDRYLAPGYVVRATAAGASASPGEVVTHTYLFLDRVAELSPDGEAPGPQWPAPSSTTSGGGFRGTSTGQRIDYGMDPDVTESSEYAGDLAAALRDVPSVSLVTDLDNLFDPSTGIYVNAEQDGADWERFGSFEVLFPDNEPGCQGNVGLRIRGGYSRVGDNPKHAFRLFFSGDYGTPKLYFPLFNAEGEASFDKIDLRTSQNYSWAFEGDEFAENTMVRDVFSRDLQRELGRPYTRSRYYHLFLDGVYWGLYQSQERAEARYAASYLGGEPEDWDVVKVDRNDDDAIIYATDGDLEGWDAVWALCEAGFDDDANYYRLEGKGPDGSRDRDLPVLVDIDNLIDYMLVVFYTANFDGPVNKFFENQQPNNFYALRRRTDLDSGFVFFTHDNEHTLMPEPIRVGDGVTENRATIGLPGGATDGDHQVNDQWVMRVTSSSKSHPQWLHHRLVENAEYRARFAARAAEVFDEGGPMAPERAIPLLEARADEIDLAIIAESARWGDAQRPTAPRTRDDDWLPAIARARDDFLGVRTPIVVEQLQQLGLYP